MSKYTFDNELVGSLKTDFVNEKNSFINTSYNTYRYGYLKTCQDPLIQKMASNLDTLYGKIDNGYNAINDYWSDYIFASDSLENSFSNISASCTNESVNSFLSSFININTSNSDYKALTFAKTFLASTGTVTLNMDYYKEQNETYSKKLKNVESNKYKITNYEEMADPDNDEGIFKKTTVGENGKKISYSTKVTTKQGTVVYYDKDGNVVKKINTDGTVEIGNDKYHKDGTVTNKTGYVKLNDGGYYSEYALANGYEIKYSDGTSVSYDNDGNVTKIRTTNSTVTYEYDSNGNIEKVNKTSTSSGNYTNTVYNKDGSYTTTEDKNGETITKNYDSSGKEINTKKEYDIVDSDGVNHGKVVESGSTKSTYSGNKLKQEETVNSDGSVTTKKYDTKGNVDVTTTVDSKGTTTKTDEWGTKVTDSEGNRTDYDTSGKKTYESNSSSETYYHDDGTYTTVYSDGSSKGYYENGTVQFESNKDNSLTTWYDQNGNFVEKREILSDGVQHFTYSDGTEKYFDENFDEIDYSDN